MKKIGLLLFAAGSFLLYSCGGEKENSNVEVGIPRYSVPYSIELIEHLNPNLPNLHSFVHATYEDKIVLIGGRRLGLHSINYNFTEQSANKVIYVLDTHGWQTPENWTVDSARYNKVAKTDPSSGFNFPEHLYANNMEFFSKNNVVYMIGGVLTTNSQQGFSPEVMTAVNLPDLISAVKGSTPMPVGAVRQTTNSVLDLTGGELGVLRDTVYLFFGWNVNNYSHQIRSFTYTDDIPNKKLSIQFNPLCNTCWDGVTDTCSVSSACNIGNFRRRDGSMSAMIDPSSTSPFFMYYSGVFKNGNTNFDTPIWVTNNSAVEQSFQMRGNVYTCKVVSTYSSKLKSSFATLLGGITNVKYANDVALPALLSAANSTVFVPDTNNFLTVPFSNRFTTLSIDEKKTIRQFLLPDSFPITQAPITLPTYTFTKVKDSTFTVPKGSRVFNGAESEIFWNYPQNLNLGNDIIDLDGLFAQNQQGSSVGYLYGGILSVVPNVNMNNKTNFQSRVTIASNRIFEIKIVPVKGKM